MTIECEQGVLPENSVKSDSDSASKNMRFWKMGRRNGSSMTPEQARAYREYLKENYPHLTDSQISSFTHHLEVGSGSLYNHAE